MAKTRSGRKQNPTRAEVAPEDCWDLGSLYPNDEAWEKDFKKYVRQSKRYEKYQGTLKDSAAQIAECLKVDLALDRLAEKLGIYAFLKTAEDQANSTYQAMVGRFQNAAVNASQLASYIRPELLAIPETKLNKYIASKELEPYKLMLQRLVRYKPHTLSHSEENLLAMQGEMAQTASKTFRQLNDADLKFGKIIDETGKSVELSNSNFSQMLISPKRSVRKTAFHQYYEGFRAHENTLASTLSGSIQADVYYAKARNYSGSLAAAQFGDDVPRAVYTNLIKTVRKHLPTVHKYLDFRRRKMKLNDLHHYDTYVPLVPSLEVNRPWDVAVDTIVKSLQPLGSAYCTVLKDGLSHGRDGSWCDRYPNQGKQSGAFSCGTYDGKPYILMNYKPKVLNDLFTLAHEAGHSMHSHYSARRQPFQYYNYTIFVAEVASTFNEQLLTHYLIENAKSDLERAYVINHEIDSIRATIVRQTMFAEFELITHEMAEKGDPLTVESFKKVYRDLLTVYFGPDFTIDDDLELECFRIPHFYRAFYVYKYATGLSASIALARRVLSGGHRELVDYQGFLQAGCSKDPLDLLKDAGVDMTTPAPINTALGYFGEMVDSLEQLI